MLKRYEELITFFLIACMMSIYAAKSVADRPPELFSDLSLPSQAKMPSHAHSVHNRTASVNINALDSDVLQLSLPDGTTVIAERDKLVGNQNGNFSWFGHILGEKFSKVLLTLHNGVISGKVKIDETVFEVTYIGDGAYAIYESMVQPQHTDPIPVSETGVEMIDFESATEDGAQPETEGAVTLAAGNTIVDLLVVYTEKSRLQWGKATLESRIASAVADANLAYFNSGINKELNVVHMGEVKYYQETGSISTSLYDVTNSDNIIDEVHDWRNAYGADLVAFITEDYSGGSCGGIAWVMQNNSTGFNTHGYSVTDGNCLTYQVLAHEIGHNDGNAHDRDNSNVSGVFDYSYGYRRCNDGSNTSPFIRTIMSYSNNCSGSDIDYFSNPNVFYSGVGTGVDNSEDNARSMELTKDTVAAFRATVSTPISIPAAPDTLTAVAASSSQIDLNWNYAPSNQNGFKIDRSLDSGVTWSYLATVSANQNSYSDTGLNELTSYRYRVYAFNHAGYSADSNEDEDATGAINNPPDAYFTSNCTDLSCTFSDNNSSDSDGTIVSYSWDFGDGKSSNVANPAQHTYASGGSYLVTLEVTDDGGATGSITKTIGVTNPTNVAPIAAFIVNCTYLGCDFNASTSSDDGSIVNYSWNFGDGNTGSGMNVGHNYANAGDITVTLIVTDNDGAPDDTTGTATPTNPPNFLNADINTVKGSVTGSYLDTQSANGIYQSLLEGQSGGRPSNRYDWGEHVWRLDLTDGNNVFNVKAYVDFATGDQDTGFDFYWSTSLNGPWNNFLLTVNASVLTEYSTNLPATGTVYIRVVDNDTTRGNLAYSTIHIDHMYIDGGTPVTTPPTQARIPAPENTAIGMNINTTLSWSAGADADSHDVYFGIDGESLGGQGNQTGTTFTPVLAVGTTYIWRIDEVNANGTTVGAIWSFTTSSSEGPTELLVDSITLSTVSAGRGQKKGHATVVVRDDFGNLISNGNVQGTFTGTYKEPGDGITNAMGSASIETADTAKKGIAFTYCVNNITHDSLTYSGQVCETY